MRHFHESLDVDQAHNNRVVFHLTALVKLLVKVLNGCHRWDWCRLSAVASTRNATPLQLLLLSVLVIIAKDIEIDARRVRGGLDNRLRRR